MDYNDYEDDEFPNSSYFDSSEIISSGNIPDKGKKLTLHITKPRHLDAVIMKSDTAAVSIPELELEEASGTGRFITLSDLLEEMRDKLQTMSGYFSGAQKHRFNLFLQYMNEMIVGERECTLIIDDPLSTSFVKKGSEKGMIIDTEEYIRSWDQNEDLGIPQPGVTVHEDGSNIYGTDDPEGIENLAELIKNSKKILGFTGAGVSVESNVPAYRGGDDAVWSKYSPKVASYDYFMTNKSIREEHWQMKTDFWELVQKAEPNPSHNIFAFLHQQGKLLSLITQNIDGMHQRAGVPDDEMICLHGTEHIIRCVKCGKTFDRKVIHSALINKEVKAPKCDVEGCKGTLRPETIFFGEALKDEVLNLAKERLAQCDLLMIMGTSLAVQPANRLPRICIMNQVPVVIVNMEETRYDQFAELVINGPSGETMRKVQEKLEAII